MIFISCSPVAKPTPTETPIPTASSIPTIPLPSETPTFIAVLTESPLPTARSTPSMLLPSVTPTLIQVPQVTNWKTYTSEKFSVSLKYPENWELDNSGDAVYSGQDGFFQITAAGSAGPTAKGLCEDYTQRPLSWKLMDYGSNPSMEILQVDDQPACLVLPSTDQSQEKRGISLLVVEYPKSGQERTRLLIFFADKNHMRDFSKTLKFVREKP